MPLFNSGSHPVVFIFVLALEQCSIALATPVGSKQAYHSIVWSLIPVSALPPPAVIAAGDLSLQSSISSINSKIHIKWINISYSTYFIIII